MAPGLGSPWLTIVISTFDRADYLARNVEWTLALIEPWDGGVDLVVVDNASSDDTAERLAAAGPHPLCSIVRNPANVGMLGNLRVCSTLRRARHVWIIGDDDFIVPGTLQHLHGSLRAEPGTPFVFMNFGVYHRTALHPADTVPGLLSEHRALARAPLPGGRRTVREAGEQHDNLFTAFYPIVFRSDVLSAVFNHPFTGRPFRSLLECVPTTLHILSRFAETPATWLAHVGIVGNANNSWKHHRVAWHAVLIPMMLELARQAGLDPHLLHGWAMLHRSLLEDAAPLFPDPTVATGFSAADLAASRRVFREEVFASLGSGQGDRI